MKHARGLKRDNGRITRGKFSTKPEGSPRGSADLRDFAPAVMNQNSTGSCVGHGVSCGIVATLAAQGEPLGFTPSPRRLYSTSRCVDRAHDNPFVKAQDLPPLQDEGTHTLTAIHAIPTWGVKATDAPMPGEDGNLVNSDVVPANVNEEPTLLDLNEQSKTLIVGAYEVESVGAQRVTDLCLALDAGHAVVFGTFVDSTFDDYGSNDKPIGAQNESDPEGGGHCMCLLGYRTENGKRVFLGRNSWGYGWGKLGDFECTEEFVKQIWECFVLDIKVVTQ